MRSRVEPIVALIVLLLAAWALIATSNAGADLWNKYEQWEKRTYHAM